MISKVKLGKFGPRVTVSLTPQDYDVLQALADNREVSVSWIIRRAIEEYLERQEDTSDLQLPLRPLQKQENSDTHTHGRGPNV